MGRARIFLSFVLAISWCVAQSAAQPQSLSREHSAAGDPVEALLAIKNLPSVYFEDGASDGTLTENPVPEIKRIMMLGQKALPLLINHLDDCRRTTAVFSGGMNHNQPLRVPLGYVSLDILSNIVGENPEIFVADCADDGLGACIRDGYYFRPDDYTVAGSEYAERAIVRIVKRNWQITLSQGKLKYKNTIRQ